MRNMWDYPVHLCGMCGRRNKEGGIMHRACMLPMIYNQRRGEGPPSPANVHAVAPRTDTDTMHRYGTEPSDDGARREYVRGAISVEGEA